MKIHCKYTGIKGFLTVYDHAVRYRYMITETAKKRMKYFRPLGKAWSGINSGRFWSVTKNLV